MYTLNVPEKHEYPIMLALWESSVRATHHFLLEGDIEFFRNIILEKEVFSQLDLIVARDHYNNIIGIMGVAENDLSMLFVDPRYIGKGVGRALILHAIHTLHVNMVEVNEQNERAFKFYENFGFKVISRAELDDNGKPYPILRMQLGIDFL